MSDYNAIVDEICQVSKGSKRQTNRNDGKRNYPSNRMSRKDVRKVKKEK